MEKIKKKKKKKDNSKKNDLFIFCRSCNATIANDFRSKFDRRYCGDCLQEGYMGLDQYGQIRNKKLDWKKIYSDKYEPQKDGFVWRKHARLQKFMAKEYADQNPKEDTNAHSGNIDGLGFNGDDHKVTITKDILKRLDEAINEKYFHHFAPDGFFWGQQYQEEQAKSYKKQDLEFVKFCKDALKKKEVIEYSCSW